MTRCIAFILALMVASVTVSSACLAADPRSLHLTGEADGGASWSSAIPSARLVSL